MNPISISSTEQHFTITIDKNAVNKVYIFSLLERLRIENLIERAALPSEIEQLGKEIKASWWEQNKEWFLNQER